MRETVISLGAGENQTLVICSHGKALRLPQPLFEEGHSKAQTVFFGLIRDFPDGGISHAEIAAAVDVFQAGRLEDGCRCASEDPS
jgi:hypothetical protein